MCGPLASHTPHTPVQTTAQVWLQGRRALYECIVESQVPAFAPLIIALILVALAVLVRIIVKKRGGSLKAKYANLAKLKMELILQRARPKVKILVPLYQIIGGIGATFAIPFPNIYEKIVSGVSGILSIELNEIMPLDCLVRNNFNSKLIFKTVWPLVAYALLYLLSKLFRMVHKERHADSCIDYLFLVMFLMYPSISNSLLSMFYCVELEDRTSWLRSDLSIQCTDTSGELTANHAAMQAFAVIMIFVHVIGTPATYAYLLLWKHVRHAFGPRRPRSRFDAPTRSGFGVRGYWRVSLTFTGCGSTRTVNSGGFIIQHLLPPGARRACTG